ncbi:MAG: glycoside hydrolase family 99-like domain-containing protein [Kiritimatiellaeota bacterium]|nr:glycoside hydrolase family 99-like domain-containing protein [Kiritimatiellota bacterium]
MRQLVVCVCALLGAGMAVFAAAGVSIRENSFQSDCPVIRAERPFRLAAVIDIEAPGDFECRLTAPEHCVVSDNKRSLAKDSAEESWQVVCREPGQVAFTLELVAGGEVVQKVVISQAVLPPRTIEKLDYIPAPKPVKTSLLVGAHNCPLWETDRAELWNQVVKKHQERTPALGIYSQDNPELADWETKWAVEHGVSFFIYCWYRTSQGGPVTTMFEQSIFDDALFKSRFDKQMKFTIMWENQRRGIAGIADMKDLQENLMPYWIEKFFKRENYMKVDNKPLLFVYQPHDVARDLGGDDKAKAAFDLMREMAKAAGFDGLYLLGEYRGSDANHLRRYKAMGLDYTFAYCWFVHHSPPPPAVIENQMAQIKAMQDKRDILPQIVTLSQAWSGWKDEGSIWKLPPADWETLLRRGKDFIEANIPKDELGSKMLILDNWNEWSEGHYIAPYREHGFGYLDAVRRVFSDAPEAHDDLLPEDIGMGPYSLPKTMFENRTSWTFRGSDYDNWKREFSPSQDWRAMMHVKDFRNVGQCLTFESTTFDPALGVRQDYARASRFERMIVRMKTSVTADDMIQIFWKTEQVPQFSEEHSIRLPVRPSADFVEYVFPLKGATGWQGRIIELRLDPVSTAGVKIEIEHIRLE